MAFEVAKALRAPLDVLVVRKLGVPFQPELAFGAIGEDGVRVLNDAVVREAHLDGDDMDAVERKQRIELRRRAERFRRGRDRISLTGRIAMIVDDGIATGATAKAACQVARAHGASRVVLAVPIGPDDIVARFAGYADEVVCLQTPAFFFAVGQGYRNFTQTSDDEVIALLDRARRRLLRRQPAIDAQPTRRCAMRKFEVARRAGDGGRAPDHPRTPEGHRGFRTRQRQQQAQPPQPLCRRGLEPGRARHAAVRLADPGRRTQPRQRLRHRATGRPAGRRHRLAGQPARHRVTARGLFRRQHRSGRGPGRGRPIPDVKVGAVVSRGGRPDLAGRSLAAVAAPTLLIVGGRDEVVLELNRRAQAAIPGNASSLSFPAPRIYSRKPGTLETGCGAGP